MKKQQKLEVVQQEIGKTAGASIFLALLSALPKILDFIYKLIELKKRNEAQRAPGCDKHDPNDPHYGQAGDYDDDCTWIPEV